MKKIKETLIPLSFMISIPISNIFYKILNKPNEQVYNLTTGIDEAIPFLNVFIIPYIIWYPFIAIGLIYLCMQNKDVYYKTLISLNIALILCYITYYFFQTIIFRPILTGNDILTKMVDFIYTHDNPFNCFPSVHVTTTYITMKGISLIKNNRKITVITNVVGVLIILSTQFVKQHVIADLFSAIIISEIIFRIVNERLKEGENVWKERLFSWLTMKKRLEN